MDGVEGAGPLPSDERGRAGRARPDQSYLDASAHPCTSQFSRCLVYGVRAQHG